MKIEKKEYELLIRTAEAFLSVLDGQDWRDIQYSTGMSDADCQQIIEVKKQLIAASYKRMGGL